jgi:ABC-type transport system involved in multi-copper enzyme maturation permease subunit
MRRELAIVFRARVTWIVAALAALLVGHGFILAVDLFSASSRSALASTLQSREMDPLAGIVRPTLGGVGLATLLLGPLVAARALSMEKERRTYGALCLAAGSVPRVLAMKVVAAVLASSLLLVTPVVLVLAFCSVGGHIDAPESLVAFGGELMRTLVVVGASLAGAAWTRTLAQAVTVGVAVSLTSWAIDAAEGFAALAWLGGASTWSIERQLIPFGRGLVAIGPLLWLLIAVATGFALALVGGSFTHRREHSIAAGLSVLLIGAFLMSWVGGLRRSYDWTEERRASLPLAVVDRLRSIPGPIELDVYLDRDDSRRRQAEADTFQKLLLARSDVTIRMPLDLRARPAEAEREGDYGRIVVRANGGVRETRSTSRRELTTLIFEAAGSSSPDWNQPSYPGFPIVIEGARRAWLVALAYLCLPLAFLVTGIRLSQRRTVR